MLSSPIVAASTPFQLDGRIDLPALGDYLDLLTAAGVRTVLVNGTTAEFASLSGAERQRVVEYCRGRWAGELIAHIGSPSIAEAMELAHHAAEHCDRLAAISPYFFADAPVAGIEQYFAQLLEATPHPVLLYNFPRHTQNPLGLELVSRLADRYPQVCGIKDSGKDLAVTREFKIRNPRLAVFAGNDRVGARLTELGIDGVVTGAGGPVAELPVAIAAASRAGLLDHAQAVQRGFDTYTDTRKSLPLSDIAFAKAAIAERLPGFPTHVRPPLIGATSKQSTLISAFMRDDMLDVISRARTTLPRPASLPPVR
ncbi:dihydrodipicolinate synthase family protein [Nocardia brasiliensis]|uniref:dihydrodipicolinate synthase family protein n=1 Tax=Nocardia brasiliensis TaxID=37326 RepID=UPI0037A5D87C